MPQLKYTNGYRIKLGVWKILSVQQVVKNYEKSQKHENTH